jgi:competence protein ComEA
MQLRRITLRAHHALRTTLAACLLTAVALAVVGSPVLAAQRLDVNAATVEQLTELPGIGEAKARAIVAARAERPFSSVDDLERVKGIGPSLVIELRDRVSVGEDAGK